MPHIGLPPEYLRQAASIMQSSPPYTAASTGIQTTKAFIA